MQEVNLLSEELKPQHDPFSLREFGLALGVLVCFLSAFSGWQAFGVWSIERDVTSEKRRLAKIGREITTLQLASNRKPDKALTDELSALKGIREEQRHLAAVLEKEPINHGFHAYLNDLATIEMRSLWFDAISLDHGGQNIRLAGFSESAEQIPLYLSILAKGSAFSGYSFDGLQIERETDDLVKFTVHGPQDSTAL